MGRGRVFPARLASAREMAESCVAQVRQLSRLLRPPMLDELGIVPTVNALAAFDPAIKPGEIQLEKTYTNEFAKKANLKYK